MATNAVDTITEVQDRYILGSVREMAASTNFNMLLVLGDDPTTSNVIWVYKYLWDGTNKAQSAWSRWVLLDEVAHLHFDDSEIFVVLKHDGKFSLNVMDLDMPSDDPGYHVCLDRKVGRTRGGNWITVPFKDAAFVQATGCAFPGRVVTPTQVDQIDADSWRYSFDDTVVPEGARVIGGLRYRAEVTPTQPFIRDRNGRVRSNVEIVVTDYHVC